METVAFYSYKGSVVRSRLLVSTAKTNARGGQRVIMLDLDLEAPGLHYKTNVESRVETGAVRLLQRSLDGDLPTLDEVRAATVQVPIPSPQGGWLRLLAAGPAPKSGYWADLGRLHERLARSQDAGLLEAVLDLRARIEETWNPDLLFVDTRSGVTALGGIATMALCDRVVLFTTRDTESVEGILAVADSLHATPTLQGGKRRLQFMVSGGAVTKAVSERALRGMDEEHSELVRDPDRGNGQHVDDRSPSLPSEHVELTDDRDDDGTEHHVGDRSSSGTNS